MDYSFQCVLKVYTVYTLAFIAVTMAEARW